MCKTCNYEAYCKYRIIGGVLIECIFDGYCDFQAPRDSRQEYIRDSINEASEGGRE